MELHFLIENLIKKFTETYSHEAVNSVQEMSRELYLEKTNGFKSFDFDKSFSDIKEFIEGFIEYKGRAITESTQRLSQDELDKRASIFIDTRLFSDKREKFKESYDLINSQINNLMEFTTFIESTITRINETEDLSQDLIGNVINYSEKFISTFEKCYFETMDELLHCSGYKIKSSNSKKESNDFFLI